MTEDQKRAKKHVWQGRGRRFLTGMNVVVSVSLAVLFFAMVNYLAYRYCRLRQDVSWRQYYTLSDKTQGLLSGIKGKLTVVAFVRSTHDYAPDIKNLLDEYSYAVDRVEGLELDVEIVDPYRDVARAEELVRKYDVDQEKVGRDGVMVFEMEGRRKQVEVGQIFDVRKIVDYELLLQGRQTGIERKKVAFRGEQICSSAIQSIAQSSSPVVYFTTGHGERILVGGGQAGYSLLAREMVNDNMVVKSLNLAEGGGIPQDCSVIVVAGPDRKFSQVEADLLAGFLERNGRLLLLTDPATTTGLEKMMQNWGVRLGSGTVAGLTMTGRELVVTEYGDHPVTEGLKRRGVTTIFYMPRPLESLVPAEEQAGVAADRPRVSVLAACTDRGWLERDLSQSPPKFNPDIDQRGPVAVAVAVERGLLSGIDVEIKPTRLVVVGDSDFVSNGSLTTGIGGSKDFFMCALNWLVERESLMAIAPRVPGELALDMNRSQLRFAALSLGLGLPLLIAALGIVVWAFRRH